MERICMRPQVSSLSLTLAGVFLFGLAPSASARITKVEITSVQSPAFGGMSFGNTGPYEKLVGRAYGDVDPQDAHNSLIADIGLAPRNARGRVEYSMDIYILRPVDNSKGNRRVLLELNNRGNKLALQDFNNTSGGNDPSAVADAGNGFLMREGYAIVWIGWDVTVAAGGSRLTITVPVAKNPDGSSISGPALEEFAIDDSATMTGVLTYAAATLNKSLASLTVRNHYSDVPKEVPVTGWEYVDPQTVRLSPPGTPFQAGSLYEFTYTAKDPLVAGLAFAATRDFAAFLHRDSADEAGNPNPLSGRVQFIYSFGHSQPARFMHDFLFLGFNEDEQGRRVFDGMDNWIGGGSRGFFNYRFAQPGRTHRQHINRWYPELLFPFTNQVTFDPVTGKLDGWFGRCSATDTCPLVIEANSENEYWSKAGSLLTTDMFGNDLDLSGAPNVRFYLLSSLPHGAATGVGICQQPRNTVVPNPGLRGLLVALDEWVSWGVKPPANQVPRRSSGTLVPALPQESAGFPRIPGAKYNGLLHTGDLYDFGPAVDQGIVGNVKPVMKDSAYVALVPRTDPDGNDIAGIRLPEIAVPLATYTGWALRAGPAADDGCDAAGQQIPFPQSAADRLAKGDPRLSIEERYETHEGYVREVEKVVRKLVKQRVLLLEDAEQYVNAAGASSVLR